MKRAILLSFALTLLWGLATPALTPDSPAFTQDWDHHIYIAMAQGETVNAPYAYRILTPGIARLMPFDLTTNFRLITFIALWLTGIAVYALALAWGYSALWGLVGCGLFYSLYWAVGFTLYDFWLCDPITFLIITLAIRSARLGNAPQFAILLLLGALNKEATLAVIPVWFAFNRGWARGLIVVAPSLLTLLALRVIIHPIGSSANDLFIGWRISSFNGESLWAYTLGPFGLLFLAILSKRNIHNLRMFGAYLALVYAQLAIANNTERLLVLAFPAVIVMALESISPLIRGLTANRRVRRGSLSAFPERQGDCA